MLKKNLITKISFLFTAAIVFTSCNKDDLHNPNPNPAEKRIWKIKTNDIDSTLFAYTTSGELHKVITTEEGSGNDVVTYTFIYTPTSKVSEISSTAGDKHKFVYEGNRLKLTENYVGANKVSENHFEYSDNRVSAIIDSRLLQKIMVEPFISRPSRPLIRMRRQGYLKKLLHTQLILIQMPKQR
jgi:hypothetical protein